MKLDAAFFRSKGCNSFKKSKVFLSCSLAALKKLTTSCNSIFFYHNNTLHIISSYSPKIYKREKNQYLAKYK